MRVDDKDTVIKVIIGYYNQSNTENGKKWSNLHLIDNQIKPNRNKNETTIKLK